MYCNSNLEDEFNEFIQQFDLQIRKQLTNTSFQEREDLLQEIHLKMYEKYLEFETREESIPGFVEFLLNQ
ncbi:hypothetical protein [Bacillus cereus]|uniref:hypothetical protein n=1 Tax=Bacillus cereus TaxID=1396 RepID=UPI000BECDEB5|nr:hypothetical protein [Bacillus cereus]PDY77411.1 hypothetical protein CON06_26830 [Bacillus cereus]PFA13195.1 hypothetical protein CN382_14005 [Bacillus cereus]PFM33695.1 hypothetical protein COJ43_25455 [Bacillus cereus]